MPCLNWTAGPPARRRLSESEGDEPSCTDLNWTAGSPARRRLTESEGAGSSCTDLADEIADVYNVRAMLETLLGGAERWSGGGSSSSAGEGLASTALVVFHNAVTSSIRREWKGNRSTLYCVKDALATMKRVLEAASPGEKLPELLLPSFHGGDAWWQSTLGLGRHALLDCTAP